MSDHDIPPGNPLQMEFQFDKFIRDLENRHASQPRDTRPGEEHNRANRLRDARNRESLHNRIRWHR